MGKLLSNRVRAARRLPLKGNGEHRALAALRGALEAAREPVLILERESLCIVHVNPAGREALEATRGVILGQKWQDFADKLPGAMLCDLGGRWQIVIGPARESSTLGKTVAARDSLTGLATREALIERVAGRVEILMRGAVLFIDLDNFKQVNDTWGHLVGDHVLQLVATRLAENVRPQDLVVRYGGDEFVVLVEAGGRRRDVDRLRRRLARALGQPAVVDGAEIALSASVGIACRLPRPTTLQAMIAEADRDMYQMKALSQRGEHKLPPPIVSWAEMAPGAPGN